MSVFSKNSFASLYLKPSKVSVNVFSLKIKPASSKVLTSHIFLSNCWIDKLFIEVFSQNKFSIFDKSLTFPESVQSVKNVYFSKFHRFTGESKWLVFGNPTFPPPPKTRLFYKVCWYAQVRRHAQFLENWFFFGFVLLVLISVGWFFVFLS